jgi:phytoene dehydrogenase-like protein
MSAVDAVVVGAGPNGLVAANRLIDAGWSVVLLEEQATVGGAVRSDRELHPDFVHDTFSAFYPLAAASRTIASFGLEEHGLVWRHAPAVLGHLLPDGGWALLHRDREVTAGLLERRTPGAGGAWLEVCEQWDLVGDALVAGLLTPFPPVRPLPGLFRGVLAAGGLSFVRTLLMPATDLADDLLTGDHAKVLVLGNAGHADIPLDAAGSGLMGLLMTMLGQTVGFPVPEGGAGRLAQALANRFTALGGLIRTGDRVDRVVVERGRAVAVRTDGGDEVRVRHAVLADVVAPHLYGGLVRPEDLPARMRASMRRFDLDPSTVKVDWALDGPVPWQETPEHAPGTVHVADSPEQVVQALAQVAARGVPADPFLLIGQMTTADPTRSPTGTESMWAYTHVPQHATHDAGADGDAAVQGTWDDADRQRFADRMQRRIERLAPGFESRILARRVLGPREMEARDANLIGGAVNGGTAQLHQQLVFRPVPGLGRAETSIAGLFLASASAHPGGGVHGAPGDNAARAALARRRRRLGRDSWGRDSWGRGSGGRGSGGRGSGG